MEWEWKLARSAPDMEREHVNCAEWVELESPASSYGHPRSSEGAGVPVFDSPCSYQL